MKTIYLDNAATTPVDERVLEAMLPYMTEVYGNANSPHQLGQKAKVIVEDSREKVAEIIHAEPSEIIFTSGGTESDNAAIKGALEVSGPKNEIITSRMEHHAVLHPVELSKRKGFKPVYVEPNKDFIITAEAVKNAITDKTALVSLMHVNNEVGTVNPISEIAEVCAEAGVPFHSDTVQSLGKLPINVKDIGLNFLAGSGHKIYGPKGIGLLYVKNGSPWMPWMEGGSQERRRRGGTVNVPGVVGFAKALELTVSEMDANRRKFEQLRKILKEQLREKINGRVTINESGKSQVPHIINMSFTDDEGNGVDGEMLILNLDIEGICVSNGSACTSGALEPSHVLTALDIEPATAKSSIRVSLGKHNTEPDMKYLAEKLAGVLDRMFAVAG